MDKLYIIIPAYNEEENIRNVVRDWHPIAQKHGKDSRLVIIDDGSKDGTYEILKECCSEYPLLTPLTKPNGGHGATVLYGYQYALSQGAEFVFQTDSDGQTLSSEFEEFWKLRYDYDMVIGNRCSREDGFSRVFVTKVLKLVICLCFGVKVTDANTPFRLMQAGTLKKYLPLIPDGFNLSNVLLSVIYAKKKLRVKYLPITFRPRQGGENSINIRKITGIGMRAVKDFCTIRKTIS